MPPERLSRLIDVHAGPLELYAAQWLRQPEDAVQEAFIELTRLRREPENVVAWLYRVTRNKAISTARSAARRERHEGRSAVFAERLVERPESRLDARTATEALDELPDVQREIVVARIWGDLGFEAIAELVGSSRSTVHRQYHEALASLRQRLGLTWLVNENKPSTAANRRTSD